VALAVKVAASFGVPVQARSGGHSFGSHSLGGVDGSLIIDLTPLNTVHVDQSTWKATIGGGASLGQVTDGLFNQGKRTIAHGTCPQVGIGGHATVGGQGPLSRQFGLTLDHVLEMEVVLADGTVTRASESQNPDLYFVSVDLIFLTLSFCAADEAVCRSQALRGAGASFGVVTSFVFETHPAPTTVTHYSLQIRYNYHSYFSS
jgi:FAD/FMN-containing dehydrogenase